MDKMIIYQCEQMPGCVGCEVNAGACIKKAGRFRSIQHFAEKLNQ